MEYTVHQFDTRSKDAQRDLERFLNSLKGEIVSIVPLVKTFFLFYGSRTESFLVIEKK